MSVSLAYLAVAFLELVRPHCVRAEIAGSIRRGKPDPKVDMEEAFFPYLLSASGKTVYEEAVPHLAKMPPANLLLNPGS